MPILTEIEPCEPPVSYRERHVGPSRPIDCEILAFLAQQPDGQPLGAIRAAVDSTTHHVHARLAVLMNRGLVRRRPVIGGPQRGPGASHYHLTRTASWTCPS